MDVFVANDPDEIVVGVPAANVIASQGFCPPAGLLILFQWCNVPRRRHALIRGRSHPTRYASGTWLAAHFAIIAFMRRSISSGATSSV